MENMMANRVVRVLEALASEEVGKNGSEMIFVSEEGVVRAVFTSRSDMEAAISFAESLPSHRPVIVEDHEGVSWENETSSRRQRDDDDEDEEDDEEEEEDD
jgi:hypothetical protein